jgi:hypothetical protein
MLFASALIIIPISGPTSEAKYIFKIFFEACGTIHLLPHMPSWRSA